MTLLSATHQVLFDLKFIRRLVLHVNQKYSLPKSIYSPRKSISQSTNPYTSQLHELHRVKSRTRSHVDSGTTKLVQKIYVVPSFLIKFLYNYLLRAWNKYHKGIFDNNGHHHHHIPIFSQSFSVNGNPPSLRTRACFMIPTLITRPRPLSKTSPK